jgi:citrate synthase
MMRGIIDDERTTTFRRVAHLSRTLLGKELDDDCAAGIASTKEDASRRTTTTTTTTTTCGREACLSATTRKPGGGTLEIVDSRTGSAYRIPISEDGTVNASAFKDIKVPGGDENGLVVYDPGYTNTSPCVSRISFIDGNKGILRYRGYPIETLAEKSSYLECAFCVIYGNLPTANQLADWREAISRHSALPIPVINTIEALPHDAHPMGVILAGLNALSVFHLSKQRRAR